MGPVEAVVRTFSVLFRYDPATNVYYDEDDFVASLGDAVRRGAMSKKDAATLTSALRKADDDGKSFNKKVDSSIRLDKDAPSPEEEKLETPVVEKGDEEEERQQRARGGRSLDDDN